MTRIHKAASAALALASASFGACSSRHSSAPGAGQGNPTSNIGTTGDPGPGGTGTVGANLLIGPNVSLTSLNWTITGPNMYSGMISIGDAQSVEVVAGGIVAGSGYVMHLFGSDSAGDSCTGATDAFSVFPGQVTSATLAVTCTAPTDAAVAADVNQGSVAVDASVVLVTQPPLQCPGITSLTVSPAEVLPGQLAQLGLTTTAPSTLQWTVSPAGGGTFVNPVDGGAGGNLPNPQFLCAPGSPQVIVTATIGLLDSGLCAGKMFTTASALINCEGPAAPCTSAPVGAACGDGGLICNGGGACVVPSFSVVRVIDGDSGLTNASSAVVIERHLLDGAVIGTPVILPSAASDGGTPQPFTLAGTANTEGDLNTSVDGRYLTMAGYLTAPGVQGIVTNQTVTRGLARIDANGNVMTTALAGAFLGGNPRSAVTVDGSQFWASGTNATANTTGGIWYLPSDLQVVQMPSSTLPGEKARLVRIAAGQLYGDSDQDPPYLFTVGSGLPTTPATIATLPGFPTTGTTPSPYSFVFFDLAPSVPGIDTLYIADDRTRTGGGFEKWTLSGAGGNWSQVWSVTVAADAGVGTGFRGMAGYVTGSTVTLMATSGLAGGTPDSLVLIIDTVGSTTAPTPQIIATAAPNSTFRGVALPPHP